MPRRLGQHFLRPASVEKLLRVIAPGPADVFLEIGPGNVLKGLIRKIDPTLSVHNIRNPHDLESLPF